MEPGHRFRDALYDGPEHLGHVENNGAHSRASQRMVDVDSDGKADIVVTNNAQGCVTVRLSK